MFSKGGVWKRKFNYSKKKATETKVQQIANNNELTHELITIDMIIIIDFIIYQESTICQYLHHKQQLVALTELK